MSKRYLHLVGQLYGNSKPPNSLKVKRSTTTTGLVPTEKEDAKKLIQWAYTQPLIRDLIIHIPNEGKRTAWEGRSLALMGLRAGVSDFFLPLPRGRFHGAWLELKRAKGGRLSDVQQDWINKMLKLDYAAYVAYGFDDAVKMLEEYLAT
jgi:hypothetical protein